MRSVENERVWNLVGFEWGGAYTQLFDQVIVRRGTAVLGEAYELGLTDKSLIGAVGVDQSMGKDGDLLARIQGGVAAWRVIK